MQISCLIQFLCFFFIVNSACAQNRISAGLNVGVNFSQLNGDKHQGYNKIGLKTAVVGIIRFTEKINVDVELAYSQRGSKSGDIDRSRIPFGIHPFKFTLNYAEVSILPSFRFFESYDDFCRFKVALGLTFGRLVSSNVEEDVFSISNYQEPPIIYSELEKEVAENDLSSVVGLSFFLKKRIALEMRHTLGFKPIYIQGDVKLLSYFFSLGLNYSFI